MGLHIVLAAHLLLVLTFGSDHTRFAGRHPPDAGSRG